MSTWVINVRDKGGRPVLADYPEPNPTDRRYRKVSVDSGLFADALARAEVEIGALNKLDEFRRTGLANMSDEEMKWLTQDGYLELGISTTEALALGREAGGYTVAQSLGAGAQDTPKPASSGGDVFDLLNNARSVQPWR